MADQQREEMGWPLYGQGGRALAAMIAADGYRPDMILAIARGGLFCAGSLGYALSVKNIYVMNCEYYTGVGQRLPVPVVLPPDIDLVDHRDSKVLIADDVADTGHTLKLVRDLCREEVAEVRCAVLYEKPQSLVKCEYVWRRTSRWINFPWSTLPPLAEPPRGAVLDA